MKQHLYAIYSLSQTPSGTNYRLVECFGNKEDAEKVLEVLESVNVLCNCYRIEEPGKNEIIT